MNCCTARLALPFSPLICLNPTQEYSYASCHQSSCDPLLTPNKYLHFKVTASLHAEVNTSPVTHKHIKDPLETGEYVSWTSITNKTFLIHDIRDPTSTLQSCSADVVTSIRKIQRSPTRSSITNSLVEWLPCHTSQQHVQEQRYPFDSSHVHSIRSMMLVIILFLHPYLECIHCQITTFSIRPFRQLLTKIAIKVDHKSTCFILVL